MGVPTSAVGYTAAMSRREDHEVHKDMWWGHWIKKNYYGVTVPQGLKISTKYIFHGSLFSGYNSNTRLSDRNASAKARFIPSDNRGI